MTKYAVVYEPTRTGYSAYAPDLPGCIATGSTLEETRTRPSKFILKACAKTATIFPSRLMLPTCWKSLDPSGRFYFFPLVTIPTAPGR